MSALISEDCSRKFSCRHSSESATNATDFITTVAMCGSRLLLLPVSESDAVEPLVPLAIVFGGNTLRSLPTNRTYDACVRTSSPDRCCFSAVTVKHRVPSPNGQRADGSTLSNASKRELERSPML